MFQLLYTGSGADPGFLKGGDFCKGGSHYSLSDQQNMRGGSLLIFFLCVSSKWGVTSHLFHPPGSSQTAGCSLHISVFSRYLNK